MNCLWETREGGVEKILGVACMEVVHFFVGAARTDIVCLIDFMELMGLKDLRLMIEPTGLIERERLL